MHIYTKRAYEAAGESDGTRILVDRMWPRGVSKADAAIDHWIKDIAPSSGLRKWYGHDPEKWPAFKEKYFAELDGRPETLIELKKHLSQTDTATLVYSSKERRYNNAAALKEYIESKLL